jgi:hypothetical protein
MFSLDFSKLQLFVGLTAGSAVLVALWMALVVLHRHRLERGRDPGGNRRHCHRLPVCDYVGFHHTAVAG